MNVIFGNLESASRFFVNLVGRLQATHRRHNLVRRAIDFLLRRVSPQSDPERVMQQASGRGRVPAGHATARRSPTNRPTRSIPTTHPAASSDPAHRYWRRTGSGFPVFGGRGRRAHARSEALPEAGPGYDRANPPAAAASVGISRSAMAQASPKPTTSGVGTVPDRSPRSCPPPSCSARRATFGRRRMYKAPTPFGP